MIDMGAFLHAVADGARDRFGWVLAWVHTPRSCRGALNHALIAGEGRAGMVASGVAAMATGEGNMMSWFWLCIPLMVVFLCCWAGIPLWHTLTRWDAELKAKHAEVAAAAVAAPVFTQPTAATAAAHEAGSPAYAGVQ
jgi:hypothetical protein